MNIESASNTLSICKQTEYVTVMTTLKLKGSIDNTMQKIEMRPVLHLFHRLHVYTFKFMMGTVG
jgi:hypothetical protein